MRAIIVAAGRGSRLRPHTDHDPKCLLRFAGHALLDWQVAALAANGISNVGIVGGYLADRLKNKHLETWLNPRWSETNMVYSLLCARDALLSGQRVIVSYGDIIYEPQVIASLLETSGEIVVSVDRNWRLLWESRMTDPLSDAESLRIAESGRIKEIGTKVSHLRDIQAQYMGLVSFDPRGAEKFVSFIETADAKAPWLCGNTIDECYMTDVLRGMIDAGYAIIASECKGRWLEFDTAQDLAVYNQLLCSNEISRFITLNNIVAQ